MCPRGCGLVSVSMPVGFIGLYPIAVEPVETTAFLKFLQIELVETLRSFGVSLNGRGDGMPTDDDRETAEKFLRQMDAEEFDDALLKELGRLTAEQRFELVKLLIQRDVRSSSNSA
jgi:hypothetical protein